MKTPLRFAVLALASHVPAQAGDLRLKVEAGDFSRIQTIVQVQDPGTLPESPGLEDADGKRLPVQLADDGTFSFILPRLDAGGSREFRVVSLADGHQETATAGEEGDHVILSLGDSPVAIYRGGKGEFPREGIDPVFRRGGYLHPLLTPSGGEVTDDYPANHIHHHGVWFTWTKTLFQGRTPDFWNMGQGTGTVEAVSLDHHWSGPVHAGLDASHRHIDLTADDPLPVLDEVWSVRVYAVEDAERPYRLVDFRSEQRMASEAKLELPEYHYGGLGLRGHGSWDGKGNAVFLTSEGITEREQANSRAARWIHMGGGEGEEERGLAILSHPGNFRAPQQVRVHPEEPFLCFAPQMGGDMEIQHAAAYLSRYRIVTMDGKADAELLERLWNDYAHPPVTSWVEP